MPNLKVLVNVGNGPANRREVDFDAVVNLMDAPLCEQISDKLDFGLDTAEEAQVFVDEYCAAHERVFGVPFVAN